VESKEKFRFIGTEYKSGCPGLRGVGNKSRGRKNISSAHFPGQTEATATPNSKGSWKI